MTIRKKLKNLWLTVKYALRSKKRGYSFEELVASKQLYWAPWKCRIDRPGCVLYEREDPTTPVGIEGWYLDCHYSPQIEPISHRDGVLHFMGRSMKEYEEIVSRVSEFMNRPQRSG